MDEVELSFLRGHWFPVARSEDVLRGTPAAGRLLDQELLLLRDGETVTVADAHCPHRGQDLRRGEIVDGDLQCPYHGWRFSASTGRCTLIPSLPVGSSPGSSRLRTYPAEERYGLVWTCLDEPLGPLPAVDMLDERDDWTLRVGEPKDLLAGVRQLTENFRDMAHFPFVHSATMGPDVPTEMEPLDVRQEGDRELRFAVSIDLGGTAFGGNAAIASKMSMDYHLTLPCFARIRSDFDAGGHRYAIQIPAPLDSDGNRCRLFFLFAIDSVVRERHGVSMDETYEYEVALYEEDWDVVEHQMPREAPLDLHAQAHTRADALSIKYRRAYAALLEEFAERRAAGANGSTPQATGRTTAAVG